MRFLFLFSVSLLSSFVCGFLPISLRQSRGHYHPSFVNKYGTSIMQLQAQAAHSELFDFKLALLLAGFAFESYNDDKVTNKKAIGLDNTIITLTSPNFAREVFSGLLFIKLKRGKFEYQETQLAERLATGGNGDPYVVVHIDQETKSTFHIPDRVMDSWKSSMKQNEKTPVWDESCVLYTFYPTSPAVGSARSSSTGLIAGRKPSSSSVVFTVMDKDMFKTDDFIGSGVLPIDDLIANAASQVEAGTSSAVTDLTIPVFTYNEKRGLWGRLLRKPRFMRAGTLLIDAEFVPWPLPQDNQRVNNTDTSSISSLLQQEEATVNALVNATSALSSVYKDHSNSTLASDKVPDYIGLVNISSLTQLTENITSSIINSVTNNGNGTDVTLPLNSSLVSSGVIKFPKGATPQLDWAVLIDKIASLPDAQLSRFSDSDKSICPSSALGTKLIESIRTASTAESSLIPAEWRGQHGLHQLCTIENTDTDTQVTIWADSHSKQVVIAFRGTEQIKLKDILIDINLFQVPYEESGPDQLKDSLVHQGFLTAFKSVRVALLELLRHILVDKKCDDNESWEIYVTGHSLGGALASLMTFELARMTAGIWSPVGSIDMKQFPNPFQTENRKKLYIPPTTAPSALANKIDTTSLYRSDSVFLSALRRADIRMYSFGAPRVGNTHFAKQYDRLAPHSFRIINNLDIVARLPRSSQANSLLDYEHVGRTVMLDYDSLGTKLWVQKSKNVTGGSSPDKAQEMINIDGKSKRSKQKEDKDRYNKVEKTLSQADQQRKDKECPVEDLSLVDDALQSLSQLVSLTPLTQAMELSKSVVSGVNISDIFNKDELLRSVLSAVTKAATAATISSSWTSIQNMTTSLDPNVVSAINQFTSFVTQVANKTGLDTAAINMFIQESLEVLYDESSTLPGTPLTSGEKVTSVESKSVSQEGGATRRVESFIDREIQILQSLLDGRALEHHLEPSYYAALEKVLNSSPVPIAIDVDDSELDETSIV